VAFWLAGTLITVLLLVQLGLAVMRRDGAALALVLAVMTPARRQPRRRGRPGLLLEVAALEAIGQGWRRRHSSASSA
jgi:hypothetical protein